MCPTWNYSDVQRAIFEQSRCAAYLHAPALLEEYCTAYHCTPEQARAGAMAGALDWLAEEIILRQYLSLGIDPFEPSLPPDEVAQKPSSLESLPFTAVPLSPQPNSPRGGATSSFKLPLVKRAVETQLTGQLACPHTDAVAIGEHPATAADGAETLQVHPVVSMSS